jgi:hypothetical protein
MFSIFDIKTQLFFKLWELVSWDNELTVDKELKAGTVIKNQVSRQTVSDYLKIFVKKRWLVKIETNKYMFNPHFVNSMDENRLVDLYKKWDKYIIEAKAREEIRDAKKLKIVS